MTWGVILAMTTVAAGSVEGQLTGAAAELYRKAQSGHFWAQASRLKYELRPTSDGRSFVVVYRAVPAPTHWIVSSHGTEGFATDDCALWAQGAGSRDVGVVCVQWWLGTTGPGAYYEPGQEYREIDRALTALGVKPGTVMYHGFSRGSANSYAVVACDQGRGKKYFTLAVASSGGVGLDYPPTKDIVGGQYGPRPLEGTKWITSAGGRDPHADRDGIAGMQRTAKWLAEQGATVVDAIEDPREGHGALQRNPANIARVLDRFLMP